MILADTGFVYPIHDAAGRLESTLVCFDGASAEFVSEDDAGRHVVVLIQLGMRQVVYMHWERPWTVATATADYKRRTDPLVPRWLQTPSVN